MAKRLPLSTHTTHFKRTSAKVNKILITSKINVPEKENVTPLTNQSNDYFEERLQR